jgi:hypothetical protein
MRGSGEVFRGFQRALQKSFLDDHLCCHIGEFASLPRLDLLPMSRMRPGIPPANHALHLFL